jgi:hypothetical protein
MATKKAASKKSGSKKSSGTKAPSKKSAAPAKKAPAKKAATKKAAPRKAAAKRTLIEPHAGDKRYVRRDAAGHFGKQVNVGRSLAADRRSDAKTVVKSGQGDKGDTRPAKKK